MAMEPYTEFYITRRIASAERATNQVILTAPATVDLKFVQYRYRAGSVSGYFGLVKAGSGVPLDQANTILRGLMPLNGTPDPFNFHLTAAPDTLQLGAVVAEKYDSQITTAQGYRIEKDVSLGLVFYYDMTGLEDLNILCAFQKIAV